MKKRHSTVAPARRRAARQANRLIEIMFKEIGAALKDPSLMDEPEWQRVFGNKQSLVVNLQKLVQALGALPEDTPAKAATAEESHQEGLTGEEMRLLAQWLEEGRA